jgi:signal transduction histidine kinase
MDLERGDGIVRFIVRDSGIGIAPHDLARLFRPFAQVDTGLTRRHGGTGLGLYISRRLAELVGGRIDVKSELGKGSEFTLVLPE